MLPNIVSADTPFKNISSLVHRLNITNNKLSLDTCSFVLYLCSHQYYAILYQPGITIQRPLHLVEEVTLIGQPIYGIRNYTLKAQALIWTRVCFKLFRRRTSTGTCSLVQIKLLLRLHIDAVWKKLVRQYVIWNDQRTACSVW